MRWSQRRSAAAAAENWNSAVSSFDGAREQDSNMSSSKRECVVWLRKVVKSTAPGSYLIEKYDQYRREKSEIDRRKVTERELKQLNHKIEKLLTRLDDEMKTDENLAEDECVVCLNAYATMQTYPCGHKVTCRKCFIRTIQAAIGERALPLKCVICRSRIIKVSEAETVKGRINPALLSHNAPGHRFTRRFFSTGRSSLDLAPSSQGLLGCASAPNGLINPLLMQPQPGRWLKEMTTPHKSKPTTLPAQQNSVRRDFHAASELTTCRPFVKQHSI